MECPLGCLYKNQFQLIGYMQIRSKKKKEEKEKKKKQRDANEAIKNVQKWQKPHKEKQFEAIFLFLFSFLNFIDASCQFGRSAKRKLN